ncbi:MAG: FdtA/QdtA family cupin domain-containing protein [Paramuribaculum sp.]|nr:FdtA/QdtA family cupin domain-containing protein [Paramuribaculum sp.]MDE6324327.1 FdtA/QdtA family cupin domain-containing protein [Paramuribaculum sp.]MDE6488694.1 FdtA/QdtA family cupin domain-containing protein [Paramuribaculum sp.]
MNKTVRIDISVDDARLISLPSYPTKGFGSLTVAESNADFPLTIKRMFYIYDIPAGSVRGAHAHYKMNEILIAASGCFDVEVTDGYRTRIFTLRNPSTALLLPAGLWRLLNNFSSGCVVLTLCDTDYDESDYIRDYTDYISLRQPAKNQKNIRS